MYSDLITINKNFQSSINLELDLTNEKKIEEYIPTTDICDVIKKYVKSVLGISKDKATTIIGPYGKGKSFVLLVLTYIFGRRKETKTWINLSNKIKKVDQELYDLINRIKKEDIFLLPVIINCNYDNITQAFQVGLNDALKREGMDSIIPNSAYEVCISLLDKWSNKENVKEEIIEKCAEINDLNISKLRKGLESYSPTAYKQFEKLYNCVNIGLEFNPLVNNDIVKTYSTVASSLSDYNCGGMFVIFDEFSKFIESNSSNLMHDLKIIQDFAELASRSGKDSQIHLCCVAHKSLVLYENNKNYGIESFKTVEGRFKEIRFNRSLDENYEIISYAIKKNQEGLELSKSYMINNPDFYNDLLKLGLFDENNAKKALFEGCYPLNPITVYSIISISELVAQNERTLFTFLSDTDDDSFNSFLHSTDKGLFNVDKIYDYFGRLFQKEEANYIRNIWYRSESILSKLEEINDKRVIKALSIVLMINNYDKLPPNRDILALSLGLDYKTIDSIISKLIDLHYLRRNILNNLLSFALSNTKHIDENIELFAKTKFKNIKYNEFAEMINERKFIIPRRFNEENKIKRFYKTVFLSEEEFVKITSFNYYFENTYCDGVVIYLLKENYSDSIIREKIDHLNDKRIIVKWPISKISKIFYQSILRYACLNEIKKQKGIDEITKSEIDLLIQETETDVRLMLDEYFNNKYNFYSILSRKNITFNDLLNVTMEQIYTFKVIFNNELINKKDVSTQYQKAINHVIDYLIDGDEDFNYSQTSPETSIRNAVIDNNLKNDESSSNFRIILEEIKEQISLLQGKRVSVDRITKKYEEAPYGIRHGVIPVIFAKALSELADNIILYFSNKEIDLSAENLVKSISNDKYQITCSKGTGEQKEYLQNMLELFKVNSEKNFRRDTVNLSENMKKFFVGLPQIVRICSENNNFLELESGFIKLKTSFLSFNINPFETVFANTLKFFNTSSYKKVFAEIQKNYARKDEMVCKYKNNIVGDLKNIFSIDIDASLKNGFMLYFKKHISKNERIILNDEDKKIYQCILNDISYDDNDSLNMISRAVTGQFIEDWDSDKKSMFVEKMINFKDNFEKAKFINTEENSIDSLISKAPDELTGMASLLKNNVESILEEFSGSLSSSEKIVVLTKLLKDLL